jgi:hypothetical protein
MRYEDGTVMVDGDGVTIRRYGTFGSVRTLWFDDIAEVTVRRLGSAGKWRLVGAGPGGGWRNWYGWDGTRRSKGAAFVFDVGRFWRPTVTPDDPESFSAALLPNIRIDSADP